MQTISPQEFAKQHMPSGCQLLDVRTPIEFRLVHATCARNIPLDTLDPSKVLAEAGAQSQDQTLYIICKAGSRGVKACQRFMDAGFTNVVNVDGGTDAWAAAGLPVNRSAGMSLDRQVRLTVGMLVLVFGLLGALQHPAFSYAAAACGAGLAYAAITNSCLMGMLLSKMPWNQGSSSATCST